MPGFITYKTPDLLGGAFSATFVDLEVKGDLTVQGNFTFGNAATDALIINGLLHLGDDIVQSFGNTSAAPNWSLTFETADANANHLLLTGPEGDGTDVPVFAIGDASALGADLGLYDGITSPAVAAISGDAASTIYIQHDNTDGLITSSAGDIILSPAAKAKLLDDKEFTFGSDEDWSFQYDETSSDSLVLSEGSIGALAYKGSAITFAAAADSAGNDIFIATQAGGVDGTLIGGSKGGDYQLNAGAGSVAGPASAAGGGDGGDLLFVAGAGGNGDGAGGGGNGGTLNLTTGAGGDDGATAFFPGTGGDFNLTMGAGGGATAAFGTAGIGGGLSWTMGAGGSGSGGNDVSGGTGGALSLTSGNGGDGVFGGSGATAGSVSLLGGTGGSGGATGAAGGGADITITAGSSGFAGSSPGTSGNLSFSTGTASVLGGVAGASGNVSIFSNFGAFAFGGGDPGGASGTVSLYSESGGSADGAGTGGASGAVTVESRDGGTTATGIGGAGGAVAISGGDGGASTGIAGTGGAGSTVTITGGIGGADGDASAGQGGAGGSVVLVASAGGSGFAAGAYGDIDLNADSTNALKVDGRTADVVHTRAEFYDEMWNGINAAWATRTTTGSAAAQARNNGWYRLTTGAVGTNEESIDFNDIVTFVNTTRPSFECRIDLEQTATTEVDVGFIESAAVGTDDYIKVYYDASVDGLWRLEASTAGATTTDTGDAATANEVKIRIEFTSDTALEWFIDDVSQGTVTSNVPTVALQPFIAVRTEDANARYIEVDYVKIWQDRT